jgi:hypothetical protein
MLESDAKCFPFIEMARNFKKKQLKTALGLQLNCRCYATGKGLWKALPVVFPHFSLLRQPRVSDTLKTARIKIGAVSGDTTRTIPSLRRQTFLDFETSFAFWLTAHRHLLGKQAKSTAPWPNYYGDFAGSLAGAPFAYRWNSHYLRRAMHSWLTARDVAQHGADCASKRSSS